MMGKSWTVYEHIFPDGGRYIGITSTVLDKRWMRGKGYETQPKIAEGIAKYGWDSVEHRAVLEGLTEEQAKNIEQYLIAQLNTRSCGYNMAPGGDNVAGYYLSEYLLAMIRGERKIAEEYGLPVLSAAELVYSFRDDAKEAPYYNYYADVVRYEYSGSPDGFSTTDDLDVADFWYYFAEVLVRENLLCSGHGSELTPIKSSAQWRADMIEGGIA